MKMFTVDVSDREVTDALASLVRRLEQTRPILQQIGEGVMERTKERYTTSTGPDGVRWSPNARSTIEAYIASRGGFGKRGITKKGMGLAMAKKPLIGHTGDLRRQYYVVATSAAVTVGNSMIYAAIQQFGGKTKAHDIFPRLKKALAFGGGVYKKVHHPGSTIPARPALPVRADGTLYTADRDIILDQLNAWLAGDGKN